METTTKTVLASVAMAAIISVVISISLTNDATDSTAKHISQVYPQIRSSGMIRAGYAVGAPLFTIDPNTDEKSGIFYEVMTTAVDRLGLEVTWVTEAGYGQMSQDLRDGKYDIVGSGVWINSERARTADFTIPVFYDAVYAYTRTDQVNNYSDVTSLNSSAITISTMDGELAATIAKMSFPNAKTLSLTQNSPFAQMILNVVEGKADVVFLAQGAAADYQAEHPGKITCINPEAPLRIFPNALMMAKGQYLLRDALNYTLAEMINDGTIDSILKKYEDEHTLYLRTAPPFKVPAQ